MPMDGSQQAVSAAGAGELFAIPEKAILKLHVGRLGNRLTLLAAGSTEASLTLLDLSDPAKPTVLSTLDLGTAVDLALSGTTCYVCTIPGGVVSVDLGTVEEPKTVGKAFGGTLPVLPSAVGVVEPARPSEQRLVCVAVRARPMSGSHLEDLMAVGFPASDWQAPPHESARDVETTEGLGLYVLGHRPEAEGGGLAQVGFFPYPKLNLVRYLGHHQPWEIASSGTTVLLASGRSGLFVFDVSRLQAPEQGDAVAAGPRIRGVKTEGPYAFVTGDGALSPDEAHQGLIVLDLTNHKQPVKLYPWATGRNEPSALRSCLLGPGLLVLEAATADGPGALAWYYLVGPGLPRLAARQRLTLPDGAAPTDVVAVPGHVFVSDDRGNVTVFKAIESPLLGAPPTFEEVHELAL